MQRPNLLYMTRRGRAAGDDLPIFSVTNHHHHRRRTLSDNCIHIIPIMVLLCLFILWWFCYPGMYFSLLSSTNQLHVPLFSVNSSWAILGLCSSSLLDGSFCVYWFQLTPLCQLLLNIFIRAVRVCDA